MVHFSLKYAFLFLCILFWSCELDSNSSQRPENILKETEFVDLLVNLSLSESAYSLNLLKVKNLNFDSVYAFNPLKENTIRKSQYDSTLLYYAENIKEYKLVYEKVMEQLSSLQTKTQHTLSPSNP